MSTQLIQLGAAVRAARLARGLTQTDLSALTSISGPRLSLIERGQVDLRFSTLTELVCALDLDLNAVMAAPPQISVDELLRRRDANQRRLRDRGIGYSDPLARLDRRDARGEDTSAERAVLAER
jgi:transcriptional regulator with XRE-family HTH domain